MAMDALRHTWRVAAGAGVLSGAVLQTGFTHAQEVVTTRMERDTPSARSRQGFEITGIAFGQFNLSAAVATETAVTDNLYARRDVKIGDASIAVRPSLALTSAWSRHSLALSASAGAVRHASHPVENVERYALDADGRLDLGGRTQFSANIGYARRIEARGTTGDTLFGAKPIAYRALVAGVGFDHDFGRTKISLSGDYERYRYEDRLLAGTEIDLSPRNYEALTGNLRVAQAVSPGVALFASGTVSRNRYPVRSNGLDRASTGYAALGGLLLGNNRLLRGEVGLGYLRQDFRDTAFPDISGLDYYAKLSWSPTQLTEVRFSAAKSFQRSPVANIAGVVQQDFTFRVEHELLRNLLLRPRFSYETVRFRGGTQRNRYLDASFQSALLIGRHLEFDVTLQHGLGRINQPTAWAREYDQNRATLGLIWRL